jgi:pilus assembly protein CpaE
MSENQGVDKTEKKDELADIPVGGLLPPAQIHLFSEDEATLKTFQELSEDWRFGRISMSVRGKNLDEAIAHYTRRKSPTLIIIQTEDTSDAFQGNLGGLADVCQEGTAAIVIGPVNDVQLYRHLTGMGISDYLVKPVSDTQFTEAIATALQDIVGAVDSHLMAIAGVKGGVGTTTLCAMTAHVLSKNFQAKTLILDASGGASTLWTHFGFSPSGTLIEAARAVVDRDNDAFERLIVRKNDYLYVLNCGAESILDNPIAPQAFEMLLDKCLTLYPNVIVDLSRAPVKLIRMVTARANSIGIVTAPRVPDLSIAKLMLKNLRDMPGAAARIPTIFLNKIGAAKASDITAQDVKDALQSDKVVPLPWNSEAFAATENSGDFIATKPAFKKYQSLLIPAIEQMTGYKQNSNDLKTAEGGLFSFLKGGS